MMRHGLVGLDVLNIAVHLTAAMLAGTHPDTPFDGECLLTMPFGEQEGRHSRNRLAEPARRNGPAIVDGHGGRGVGRGSVA